MRHLVEAGWGTELPRPRRRTPARAVDRKTLTHSIIRATGPVLPVCAVVANAGGCSDEGDEIQRLTDCADIAFPENTDVV